MALRGRTEPAPRVIPLLQGTPSGYKETIMWYFAWILGVLLALAAGVINVLWLESEQCLGQIDEDGEGGEGGK